LAIASAPVVLAFLLAARFRDDLGLRLCSVVSIAFVASIVAHAQIRGLPFVYLTLRTRSVAMLAIAAPLIVLVRNAARVERVLSRAPRIVVALASGIACLTVSVRSLGAKKPNPLHSELYARIYPGVTAAVAPGEAVRIVQVGPLYETYPQALAVPLELAGAVPKLRDDFQLQVGSYRVVPDADAMRTLFLAVGAEAERLEQQQRARLIVKFDNDPTRQPKHRDAMRTSSIRLWGGPTVQDKAVPRGGACFFFPVACKTEKQTTGCLNRVSALVVAHRWKSVGGAQIARAGSEPASAGRPKRMERAYRLWTACVWLSLTGS
jgi:hypothetical protein